MDRIEIELRPDCSKCAALCCVVLPFDRGERFGFDKQGGEPCRNLLQGHGCRIHSRLDVEGFGGCASYDCLGAGQRVVQEVFDGRSWQDDPLLIGPMGEAFYSMRQIHDQLLLLRGASQISVTTEQKVECARLVDALAPQEGWSEAALANLDLQKIKQEVAVYLKGLSYLVAAKGAKKKTPA